MEVDMDEKLIQLSFRSGYINEDKPMYGVYVDDYKDETDKEDGSTLAIIDKATHTIVGYAMAFDGFWNKS